jgi:hypothetical protein
MRNSVETGFDVPLENPLRVWFGQYLETLFNRVGAGPLLTKPVGVMVGSGFHHGIECKQMQGLLGSIFHSGNSEGAHRFAIRFRNVNASERLRLIASTLEFMYCLYLLFWCVPDFLVHPRGFLALVFRHSSNGRNLAAVEWVSRCCKARTLPHLLAFVACTIRTWSRRTLRLMVCQSMAYHSAASFETAPTACAVVICFGS